MENCCPKIVCNFLLNAQKHVGAHVKFAQQMIIAQIGLNAQTHSQKSGCVCVCEEGGRRRQHGKGAGCNANDAGSARQHVTEMNSTSQMET